jgi:hypothetical protein
VIVAGVITVIFVLFQSSINFWRGGWSIGPRYITVMLPFVLPLIASQLDAWRTRWWLVGIAAGTMLVGIAVYSLSSATFPYWPESMRNPLYELTLRLVGDGLVAPSLGTALGLSGIVSLLPYFALVAGVFGLSVTRVATWRGCVVAGAVSISIIVAYRAFPLASDTDVRYANVLQLRG